MRAICQQSPGSPPRPFTVNVGHSLPGPSTPPPSPPPQFDLSFLQSSSICSCTCSLSCQTKQKDWTFSVCNVFQNLSRQLDLLRDNRIAMSMFSKKSTWISKNVPRYFDVSTVDLKWNWLYWQKLMEIIGIIAHRMGDMTRPPFKNDT